MAQVTLKKLDKSYGDTQILHGIDLEIQDGEFAVLVGPSGCGKSTLLKALCGDSPATSGEVKLFDLELKSNYDYLKTQFLL